MNTDVALVTEHHLIVVLPIGGLANVTHHILVVLNAQSFLRLHGMRHVFVAAVLKLLHHPLHGDLIQRRHSWEQQSKTFLIYSSQTHCLFFVAIIAFIKLTRPPTWWPKFRLIIISICLNDRNFGGNHILLQNENPFKIFRMGTK